MSNKNTRGSFFYTLLGYLAILLILLVVALIIGAAATKKSNALQCSTYLNATKKPAMWTNRTATMVHQNTLLCQRGRDFLITHQKIESVKIGRPTHFINVSSDTNRLGMITNRYDLYPRGSYHRDFCGLDLREVRDKPSLERWGGSSVTRRLT